MFSYGLEFNFKSTLKQIRLMILDDSRKYLQAMSDTLKEAIFCRYSAGCRDTMSSQCVLFLEWDCSFYTISQHTKNKQTNNHTNWILTFTHWDCLLFTNRFVCMFTENIDFKMFPQKVFTTALSKHVIHSLILLIVSISSWISADYGFLWLKLLTLEKKDNVIQYFVKLLL